ncbi:MAG TPA: HEAT repeat domain-containing protein [Gemmatimonadaceae bacterium]|nr:HEAT repeat domain-containing protein [Gemmatimonadaceae bacterium]
MRYTIGLFLLGIALGDAAQAQSVARRVAAVDDGEVRMTFDVLPDICGWGNGWSRGDNWRTDRGDWGRSSARDVEWPNECTRGPGRLVIDRANGETMKVRFYVGGRWRSRPNVTDLGHVPNQQAADYLLDLARNERSAVAKEAITPLSIIDEVEVWPALLRIARDDGRHQEVRKAAIFWLGQMAGERITGSLSDVAEDDRMERDVRESAIFALSQRPRDEGVPALIRIVRTSRDPKLKKNALFWLGQSRDPRALDLIEEILSKR